MKLGSYINNAESAHVYENIYDIITYGNGTKCLRITASGSLSDLMVKLGALVRGNWYVLYTLLTSHSGNRPGRYQGIEIENFEGIVALFDKYKNYFDGDGRHNIWLGSTVNNDLLVYDKHNVIYAYGPIDAFVGRIRSYGYCEGVIKIPSPHTHHYPSENVRFEMSIMNEWDWKWYDLAENDDD